MTKEILMAGFGGQGILFSGKVMAHCGLHKDLEVSWLPSYGPEMRGGTANCSVILSDTAIGSPIVLNPDILMAMNLPSLEKYENETVSGGQIFYDSSLIEKAPTREDVDVYAIPATQLASDNGLTGLANIILVGHIIAKTGILTLDEVNATIEQMIPPKKEKMIALNKQALLIGYNY